jgi:hypothetical protein
MALERQARRGLVVSGEAVRRWLPESGWEGERAKLIAQDDDPQRGAKLARIRSAFEQVRVGVALLFADELASSLLPPAGSQWRPEGAPVELMPPATNEKRSLAGALGLSAGTIAHCVWYRKTTGLFLDRLATLDRTYPAARFSHLTAVADNAKLHHAAEVEQGLAAPPRFELLSLPPSGPRASPLERACGDVRDKCPRHHTRQRLGQLVQDVQRHLHGTGPWPHALSDLYSTPEVTAAVQALRAAQPAPEGISQLAA